ncbi:substrate-binding periplasmic protein [Chitinilyticum piscinae]|uniref:Transporter substrate-binding domain-containing protein n=1 Tax=Chitinilyticum piscinae TaxID=2866724 RepID=A0A8J7KEP5_9NEIS|nr:transporter substrate-binding domain-containing protein [Chitinilyticum piscinae]MBE9609714.1 transporter substrate-binding domain-containing protein [Chitinilyticum piscinae]
MRTILLSFSLLYMAQALAEHPTIRLMTQQQAPYNMEDERGRQSGLALDAVRCAMQRMGRTVQFQFVPWVRAQNTVKAGQADGFFPASQNSERDSYATISATVAPQQWRWYLLSSSQADPLDADFRSHYKVGAYLGSNMMQWLKQSGYMIYAAPYNHEQLLRMLLAGRVEAVLASDLAMQEAIQKSGAENRIRSTLQQDKPMGLYFSHQFLAHESSDFLPAFNRELASCRKPSSAAGIAPSGNAASRGG